MRYRRTGVQLVVLLLLFLSVTSSAPRSSDPCLDGESEIEVEKLKLPTKYANLTPPWKRADGKYAKVIRSDGLNYQWSWVKALLVKGTTRMVEDIVTFLTQNECLFVPVGPFVRNMLLAQKAVYVSGEVSCDLSELYEKCVKTFRPHACALYPDGSGGSQRLEIGDRGVNRSTSAAHAEPMVLYEWRSILGASRGQWRFTIDTLALFDDGAGDLFVVDPTRTGYDNLCDKKIVPSISDWKRWGDGQEMKVMGFYDLRAEGFSPLNETFQKYVNEKIKKTDKRITQQFYCEHVLDGVMEVLDGSTVVCHTIYPEKEATKKIVQMRTVMINEMGLTWNSSVGKAADDLEAVFSHSQRFSIIRSRLLHKKPSPYDNITQHHIEPPKIIRDGHPMINDSAQIHTRPIVGMNEKGAQLPVEYPSAPRAQPNEQLEFVEAPLIDGGGSEPVAIVGSHDAPEEIDVDSEEFSESGDVPSQLTIIKAGEPVEKEFAEDFTHHNSIGDNLPIMKFEKVEDSIRTDAAAMEISTSSAFRIHLMLATLILALHLLF